MPASNKPAAKRIPPDRSRVVGALAREQVAVLISTLGMRVSRGAMAYYRTAWNIGTVEWRLLITLNRVDSFNISELSSAADIDKAAASRSLVLLRQRKLVSVQQTRSRGRAAIAKLTADGRTLAKKLVRISRERETRLLSGFTSAERRCLTALLLRFSEALETDDWKY